ncbi:hypothetical protein DFH09DRAFT_1300292 [Mycena vulgaris]|nr:hypothetical protein DFH09DRAFT_1300292 [Mycena vulgaris]
MTTQIEPSSRAPARRFAVRPPSPESGSVRVLRRQRACTCQTPCGVLPTTPYIHQASSSAQLRVLFSAIPSTLSTLCTLRTRPHRCLSPSSLIFFFSSIVPALPLPLPVCRRVRVRSCVCDPAATMLARVVSASPACARAYTHPRAPTVVPSPSPSPSPSPFSPSLIHASSPLLPSSLLSPRAPPCARHPARHTASLRATPPRPHASPHPHAALMPLPIPMPL